jgi:hypothetical protein
MTHGVWGIYENDENAGVIRLSSYLNVRGLWWRWIE